MYKGREHRLEQSQLRGIVIGLGTLAHTEYPMHTALVRWATRPPSTDEDSALCPEASFEGPATLTLVLLKYTSQHQGYIYTSKE